MTIASINPATGETLRTYAAADDTEIERCLARAAAAFPIHRATAIEERARCLVRAAEILDAEQQEWGRLMTLEMGKPLRAAREEAAKCARACRFYAQQAERFLSPEDIATPGARTSVAFQPLGVILAVMPWNFPFWQVVRFAAPALVAGNVAVLKHASNVPGCALALADIFRRAGFAEGVFTALLVGSDVVPRLIADARVAAVTLTGSEGAGRSVGAAAGTAIKKSVLELGGSDPFIVLPSADLDAAVGTAVTARTINNGQSCIAAKRFLIHDSVYDAFERRFVHGMESLTVGDPLDEGTQIGPLATAAIVRELEEQVQATIRAGARLLTGGVRLDRPGHYYAPTALADIPRQSPAYAEELFGPVAALFRVRDVEDAIRVANDTAFGLGASAWTNDDRERARLIEGLEAGQVFINAMVASDPRLPFGGVKHSGYGRELGVFGLREFVNVKTVWVQGDERGRDAETE